MKRWLPLPSQNQSRKSLLVPQSPKLLELLRRLSWQGIFSSHGLWVTSSRLSLLPTTKLPARKTQLRGAMLVFSSPQLPRMAISTPFSKTWGTCVLFTLTVRHSVCSLRTLVSVQRKLRNLTLPSKRPLHSARPPLPSSRSLPRTSALSSSVRSLRSTPSCTRSSTRKRKWPSSQRRNWVQTSGAKSLKPSRPIPRTLAKSSRSTTKSTSLSWVACKCTRSLSSWTCHSPPACWESTRRSKSWWTDNTG